MLCATLFLGEVGVVDLEVLLWFMLCASSVESVLVTLRHDFLSLLGHSLFGRAGTVGPEVLNFDPFG